MGVKSLIYFEVVTSIALVLGLALAFWFEPGVGMNVDPKALDPKAMGAYAENASKLIGGGFTDFLLKLIPTTAVSAFANGDVLQVLLFSIVFGCALALIGERGARVTGLIDDLSHVLFKTMGLIIKLAPLGVLGAIAFTVGKYGLGSLKQLGMLVALFYAAVVIFVVVVLGFISWWSGFSLWKFLRYIKDEIFTVLGTSSSESVVPQLMKKLEFAGVSKPVVGLVVPSGVTFNPDGQCIYYTMAAIFIAQATNTPLTFMDQIVVLGVLTLTSKGSAGVTGSGFITLAATLASLGKIPVAGMVLLLGVDRFMSEARAITNTIGNAVGTVAIARWVGAVDRERLALVLDGKTDPEDLHALYEVPADAEGDNVKSISTARAAA